MSRTRKLDPIEIRVLGALLEKEQTTPDQYPLTINAVIAACNQKTNRDPVTQLTETQVVEALDRLREDVLTWRTQGARVERWQHSLDRRWELDRKTKAIMTLLLLRGPQTAGELRTRSERMADFESVDEVEGTLRKMADGFDALVAEQPRQPGQRETRWTHLEGADGVHQDLQELTASVAVAPQPAVARPPDAMPPDVGPAGRRTPYDERLERLEDDVAELRSTVATLQEQLQALRDDLGVE